MKFSKTTLIVAVVLIVGAGVVWVSAGDSDPAPVAQRTTGRSSLPTASSVGPTFQGRSGHRPDIRIEGKRRVDDLPYGSVPRVGDMFSTRPPEVPDDPPAPPHVLARRAVEPARVWSLGPFVSVQVNVDGLGNNVIGDAANEPSMAIDPTNPKRIAIGWRQFDTIASNFRQAGRAGRFPVFSIPGSFAATPFSALMRTAISTT